MKPFKKVLAAVIAVIVALSVTACKPISLTKEWSYKIDDEALDSEYAIGVYLTQLYFAYNEAQSYAQNAKGYDADESFLDLTITDGDGNKAVAEDWILDKAEENTLKLIALDYLVEKHEATSDEAEMKQAKENAKSIWEIGNLQYTSTDQESPERVFNPLSKILYDYGVSLDSFTNCVTAQYENTPYSLKYDALFKKLYDKDGVKEVSDKELKKYFEKNYIDFSMIPVNLYKTEVAEDQQTEDGQQTATSTNSTKALSKKKVKEIKAQLNEYADQLSSGAASFEDIKKLCTKKIKTTSEGSIAEEQVTTKSALKSNYSEIYKEFKKLDNGKATVVTVGKDENATAYLVVKNDVTKQTDTYVAANRNALLGGYKNKDFAKLLVDTGKKLLDADTISKNDGAIDKYSADYFEED